MRPAGRLARGLAALDLDGRVVHPETGAQGRCDIMEESVGGGALRHHQMGGERGFGGRHRPDVEIMDRGHALEAGKVAAHFAKVAQ
jgi:hypothetical protein